MTDTFGDDVARELDEIHGKPAAPPRDDRLDDIGNAARFVAQHRDDIRYVPVFKSNGWFVWDDRRWQPDNSNTPIQLAKRTARKLFAEAAAATDPETSTEIARHATASARMQRLQAIVLLASADPEIVLTPDRLDAEPWLLNLTNGTVDLRTGDLHPHERGDAITRVGGGAYDPTAAGSVWTAHLERFQPDPAVRAYLQRLVGYAAIGTVDEHVLSIHHGLGANGKSTTFNAISAALGDYAHQAPVDLLIQARGSGGRGPTPELADLRGRRLVTVAETREDHRLAVERVKAITGGDPITARFLHANPFTFTPSHTVWLATNHKPRIPDPGHAIWRRVQLCPWSVTIADADKDPAIERLLRLELDAIATWIVDGAIEYQRCGLDPPETVTAATEAYRLDEDTFGAFLEECTEQGSGAPVQSAVLKNRYDDWAHANGAEELSRNVFAGRLTAAGYTSTRRAGRSHWIGLQIADWTAPDE